MNEITFTNHCNTLMKMRTQQAEITSITTYLEYYQSLDARVLFVNNPVARQAINVFTNRGIKTMDKVITETLYPTIRQGQNSWF